MKFFARIILMSLIMLSILTLNKVSGVDDTGILVICLVWLISMSIDVWEMEKKLDKILENQNG